MAIAHCLVLKLKTSHSTDTAERRSWTENRVKKNDTNDTQRSESYRVVLSHVAAAQNELTVIYELLTLRRLMSYIYIYIYGAPILDVSRSHTTTQHSR